MQHEQANSGDWLRAGGCGAEKILGGGGLTGERAAAMIPPITRELLSGRRWETERFLSGLVLRFLCVRVFVCC